MTKSNDNRAGEPVQVYLDVNQRRRLSALADELGLSKSDVVRRGLEALERQIADPAEHPALRIIGLAGDMAPTSFDYDVARDHDRFLVDSEVKSWKTPRKRKRGG